MDTIKFNKGNAKVVAHRGLSGIEKENTASAFVAAGNRSYFSIETDVRITADGKFVLLHDMDTVRVSGDNLVPEQCTLQTLQSVQLKDTDGKRGRIDLRIPELVDYIRICKRYEKVCVLEFKGEFSVEHMEQVIALVKEEYTLDMMVFISFGMGNLVNLRKACADTVCQFLTSQFSDELVETLKANKMDVDIAYTALDEEWKVKKFLDEGIKVNVWTVDNKEVAERLVSWGVQYITSNILE